MHIAGCGPPVVQAYAVTFTRKALQIAKTQKAEKGKRSRAPLLPPAPYVAGLREPARPPPPRGQGLSTVGVGPGRSSRGSQALSPGPKTK